MAGARQDELFAGVLPFVTVASAKSFRAAARTLGMTPSGVSKAIARLEAELGVRLFRRSARSVTLTAEGESFLQGCEAAVESLRGARERIALTQHTVRGQLKVSLPLLLGQLVIVPALAPLMERHPALSVCAQLTDRFVDLTGEGIDAAVRIGALSGSVVVARKLGNVRWVTVAAPSYLARRGHPASLRQLAEHDCLSFVLPDGMLQPWQFLATAEPSAPTLSHGVRGPLASDHGATLIDAARAGLGIFQAHDYAVAAAIACGELVELFPQLTAKGPPIHVVHAQGRRGAAKLRAFLDLTLRLLATKT